MGVELIKDQKGKNHMVFSKDLTKEDLLMGDKIDNYEILQVLGEGSFGYVAKAKSRLNHKIYAIKQLNFPDEQKKKEIDLIENEVSILKNLEHPLIVKYYKSFKEGNCLYIVMEFMDNGDLGELIKGHKTLNKPIDEERLWNIFIQALQSLEFVHSKGIIHRDIKPANLFVSNDGTIKMGDFGVAANYQNKNNKEQQNNMQMLQNIKNLNKENIEAIAKINCKGTVVGTAPFMSPEMIKNVEYDLTTDVYSMGCSFFEAMYWTYPRVPAMDIQGLLEGKNILKLVDIKVKDNKDFYSKELDGLVRKMIDLNKQTRPDSSTILKLFIAEYTKKYSKSSCIGSVLSCLYNYPLLYQYFTNQNNAQNIMNNPNSISYAFLYGLNSLFNFNLNINDKEDWRNSVYKIRMILSKHNSIYHNNNELNPRYFLSFLLGRIHKELNQKKGSYQNPFTSLFSGDMNNQQQNMMNINYSNKVESFNYFINNFNENNNSIITNNFYGNMKTKTVCSKCQLITYSFSSFNFITFNLDLCQKYLIKHNYQNLMNQLNILNCFFMQNDTLINISNFSKFCRNCQANREHSERKQFYTFPRYLIICLDRGADCENKTKVSYNEILDLRNNYDNPNSFNCFMIKGVVKRVNINNEEHYISLYYDFNQKSWIVRDDSQITKINSIFDHQDGLEVMLFYEALVNNNMNNNNGNEFNTLNSNMNINLQNNGNNNNMNQNQNMNYNNMNNMNNMNNFNTNNNMNNMNMGNMNNNNMNMNNYNNMQSGVFNNTMNSNMNNNMNMNMNINYNQNGNFNK